MSDLAERPGDPDPAPAVPPDNLDRLLGLVARVKGLDLRDYQHATLARRVAMRMASAGVEDASDYERLLGRDPGEVDRLADVLLIHVTSFFRDALVFAALEAHVVPTLLRTAADRETLRALIVGTATGEEAYSLAMTLDAACGPRPWSILATDRDAASLVRARSGVYSRESLAGAVPDAKVARFFRERDGAFEVKDELRSRIRFAEYDLMGRRLAPREAILAEFDLVLCRNVLLYLDRRFQELAFQRLATLVRPGGALVLGHAESVPPTFAGRLEPFPGLEPSLRTFRNVRGPDTPARRAAPARGASS